jgi:hypothetical protein
LDYVATLQSSHDEQIGKLVEQADRNEKGHAELRETMTVLTRRTIQAMTRSTAKNIRGHFPGRCPAREHPS